MSSGLRWLVTGAGGMLGTVLVQQLRAAGMTVGALGRAQLDITDASAVDRVVAAWRPDIVVNCAAFTAVDAAEAASGLAIAVNATAVQYLAAACQQVGAVLLQLSTDYVFSGHPPRGGAGWREIDAVHPLSVYGTSKQAGELAVAALGERGLVVRTSWLFGPGSRHFPAAILARARQGLPLRVVSDQSGCPTWAPDLARALVMLGQRLCNREPLPPLLHIAGTEAVSWWQYAVAVVTQAHRYGLLDAVPAIAPVSTLEYGAPAPRPVWSVLDSGQAKALGIELSDWRRGLDQWLHECVHEQTLRKD